MAAAFVAALRPAPRARPNVLLVVIDTLRASHLGAYGYRRATSPTLDAFAAENVRFREAIAAAPWTSPSVASLFASVYPPVHGIHVASTRGGISGRLGLSDDLVTLAEILRENGYWTAAVVANPWISRELGFAQGFDVFHEAFSRESWRSHTRAERINQLVIDTLDEGAERTAPVWWRRLLGDTPAPVFLYVHYMDPHLPYEPPPRFARMFQHAPPGHAYSDFDRPEVARELALYDAEIRYVDAQLGQLLAHLRQRGGYEDAVIAITSDHGEQFYEYGKHGHGYSVHKLELHVPLLMRLPGMRGVEVGAIVSTIDVAPTLLDAAGIALPLPVQGVSLVSALDEREQRGVYAGMTYRGNAKSYTRADGKKLIVLFAAPPSAVARRRNAERLSVYDSLADYREQRPLEGAELLDDLRVRFFSVYRESARMGQGIRSREVRMDPQMLEQLRQLGYSE